MNTQELREKYLAQYEYMANSRDTKNMKVFGRVMTTMIEDMIQNSPSKAEEYINKLEAVKWKNYLTTAEADKIVTQMEPKAPWSSEQWRQSMERQGLPMEEWPIYNKCALYTTMNMIMSDSSETLENFVQGDKMFKVVHELALDKLKDKDGKFEIRRYFEV